MPVTNGSRTENVDANGSGRKLAAFGHMVQSRVLEWLEIAEISTDALFSVRYCNVCGRPSAFFKKKVCLHVRGESSPGMPSALQSRASRCG